MDLTVEQALALAPDANSATAGRKLAKLVNWRNLGRSEDALWGECQGSALYQTRIDLRDYATNCSCPSRKFPCKHALGLLMLAATSPEVAPNVDPPEWVTNWLKIRSQRAARTESTARPETATAPQPAQGRRQQRRLSRVQVGVDALDLWLDDLIRNGLAQAGMQPASFWKKQAARLVDAQAPGLASRVRRIAAIPNASPDWPARLLSELGRLALLTHAFRRIDQLDPDLQDDVRTSIGWTLERDEVFERGETLTDEWLVIGQRVVTEEQLRAQRTWLVGAASGRSALVLQFAHGTAPFADAFAPGTQFAADLTYFPSAFPQRAIVRQRHAAPRQILQHNTRIVGDSVDLLLASWAAALGKQPWIERIPAVLRDVVPARSEAGGWLIREACGKALALEGSVHWTLLAYSGGEPIDLIVEWDGEALAPLGVFVANEWHALPENG